MQKSVPASGSFDTLHATWKISKVNGSSNAAILLLDGTVAYESAVQYAATELYALQTSIEGQIVGRYNGALTAVLTHVRVNSSSSPHNGQGFSVLSFTTPDGSGQGWSCDHVSAPNLTTLEGFLSTPLAGVFSGVLDERSVPRTLSLPVERSDAASAPQPNLVATVAMPARVWPGGPVAYTIKYRNDGLATAQDMVVAFLPPEHAKFVSVAPGTVYDPVLHVVKHYLAEVHPEHPVSLP